MLHTNQKFSLAKMNIKKSNDFPKKSLIKVKTQKLIKFP